MFDKSFSFFYFDKLICTETVVDVRVAYEKASNSPCIEKHSRSSILRKFISLSKNISFGGKLLVNVRSRFF